MPRYNLSNIDIDSTLFNKLSAHVALINQEGEISAVNKAWQNFDDSSSLIKRSKKGTNYFEMLRQAVEMGNDYALKQILGMKKVFRQEKESFVLDYPLKSDKNLYWFKLNFHPCNDDHSLFVAIHEDVSTTIQNQQEQKEIKNRYQVQFEQSLDGILITDTHGQVIDANPAASDILGWESNELITRTRNEIMDVANPDYQSALKERKKKGLYKVEMDLFHKHGTKIPAEVTSRAYRTRKGKLRAIVSFRDISRRKNIERDLDKTRKFTESALNSIPGIFFVLNENGKLIRWNDNMVDSLGYTAEELSQKNALDFVVEKQKPFVRTKIKECLEVGELSIDTKIVNINGHIHDYHILAKRFTRDGQAYLVATGINITERKQTELENQKAQLMVEQLFENAPVGIAILNPENKIERINKSFEQLFEYTEEEVKQKNIDEILVPKDKQAEAQAISASTQNGDSLQAESKRLKKNGEQVPVLIGSVPVIFHDEVIAYYGIYVNISEQHDYRKKIEGALREKDTLLSELHHRVKNNLALISSLVELQVYESDNDHLQQELTNTKNRILTIASIHEVLFQNGNLTNIPFTRFLEELAEAATIKEKAHSNNIRLNTHTEELILGINQSIPCGLFLNEMLSLICENTNPNQTNSIDINFREYGKNIHIILEGNALFSNLDEIKKQSSLHNILIETLVTQLNGKLLWPTPDSNSYQKVELIFSKEHSKGSASGLVS